MKDQIKQTLEKHLQWVILQIFKQEITSLELQHTKEEFVGNYTLVVFPLVKQLKENPQIVAEKIGEFLVQENTYIHSYNVIQGFLNVELQSEFLITQFQNNYLQPHFGQAEKKPKTYMVEYSSPNTNKPLHLGHLRNILLGSSVHRILQQAGYTSHSTQIINDRGIHISKSMLAWQKFGNGQTPQSTGMKGDHFVGEYYVKFDQEYHREIAILMEEGMTHDLAKEAAPIMKEAQLMLKKWEENDPATLELWHTMNTWVYEGFNQTYQRLHIHFDSIYYESNTYLLGKNIIAEGLEKGIFKQKEDGSVWVDLTDEGLDEKLVLRKDGTSVYITQDIGTAVERFKNHNINALIYTVGNEQDYHFKVLFLILNKLGYHWANDLHHLSYGMVTLPEGKMKSREGTVVDADDLLNEMHQTAKELTEELGKIDAFNEEEKNQLYEQIGQAALRYYILKVDSKKNIMFNPKESIEFNGNTGPFIQYTYARIQSLLTKATQEKFPTEIVATTEINETEKNLILLQSQFPEIIEKAAEQLSPALIANYVYELAKQYNSFYQENPILQANNKDSVSLRIALSSFTARILKTGLGLLGIEAPQRM